MKKWTAILLAALLTSCLIGCSNTPAVDSETPTNTQNVADKVEHPSVADDTTDVEPAPEIDASANEEYPEEIPTFGVPADGLIDAMSKSLDAYEIQNVLTQDPTIREMDDGTTAYSYDIAEGCYIIFYEETISGNLAHAFIIGKPDVMDVDGANLMGAYEALLTEAFSGSSSDLEQIDKELDIVNAGLTNETYNMYDGELASFTYMVNNGSAMLSVTPLL